ncbi:MAG: hypothetical protein AAFY48_21135, partial [Bacteroidota bacterium]
RSAQLSFLSTQDRLTAHPHYWAGFVLVGPDNTFSSSSNRYIWILGGLLLLGILAIFGRRK